MLNRIKDPRSLSVKLLIPFLFVTLVAVVGATISIYVSYTSQREFADQLQQGMALQAAVKLDDFVQNIQLDMQHGAEHAAKSADHSESYLQSLKATKETSPALYELSFIDSDGQEVAKIVGRASVPEAELKNLANDPKFTQTINGANYIGPVYISEFEFPFASFSTPIFDAKHQVKGVLAAEVDISQMWNDITEIAEATKKKLCPADTSPEDCPIAIYVVDLDGHLIAINSDTSRTRGLPNLLQPDTAASKVTDVPIEGVEALVNGNFDPLPSYIGIKDETGQQTQVIGAREMVPNVGWGVIVERPASVAVQQTNFFALIFIAIVLLIILIAVATGYYVIRKVIQPLGTLREGAAMLARGNFDHVIQVASKDEIGFLAHEFNEMSAALFESQQSLADAAEESERFYLEEQRHAKELNLVNQINYTAMASLDIETTIDAVLRNIKDLTDYTSAEINIFDQETKCLQAHAVGDTSYTAAAEYRYAAEEGFSGWIFKHRKSLLVPDAQDFTLVKPKLPIDNFSLRSFIGLPLIVGEELLGTLELAHQKTYYYSEEDLHSLQALAGQAALAIRHAQLFQESRERARGQEQLASIAAIASSTLQLENLLNHIMAKTVETLDAEMGAVLLLDEDETALYPHPASVIGFNPDDVAAFKIPTSAPQFQQSVLAAGQPFFSNEASTDERILSLYQPFLDKFHVANVLVVPMTTAEKNIGELYIINKNAPFRRRDIIFLSSVASHLAAAVQNATLFEINAQLYKETDEQLKLRLQELNGLQKVNRELNSTLVLDVIIKTVMEEATRATGADFGNVSLYDQETKKLKTYAHSGWPQEAIEQMPDITEEIGIMGRVLRQNAPELVDDVSKDPDYIPFPISTRSEMVVPIRYSGTAIDTGVKASDAVEAFADVSVIEGVINLESKRSAAFTQEQLQYVQALADQAAIAIRNARAYANQVQERREAATRASQLGKLSEINRAFRANQQLEDILEDIAFAIQETAGFNIVLASVIENDMLRRITGAGIPLPTLDEARKQLQPVELLQDMMRPEFKMSESYFIPAEKGEAWQNDLYDIFVDSKFDESEVDTSNAWHKEDFLLIPLNDSEGNMIGLLSVDAPFSGKRPTLREITVLELFASQAATAIENTKLFQELEHQTTQIMLFSQISSHISAILNPGELMGEVVSLITNAFSYYFVQIFQLDPQQPNHLALKSWAGRANIDDETIDAAQGLPIDDNSIVGWVARHNNPLLANNVQEDPRYLPAPYLPDTMSEMTVPLRAGTIITGVLDIQHNQLNAFTEDDLHNLQTLADQLSVAIQNANLFDDAIQRERLSSALGNTGLILNRTLDPDTVVNVICEEALAAFNVDGAYLWLVDGEDAVGAGGAGEHKDQFIGKRVSLTETKVLGIRIIQEQRAEFINGVDFTQENISQSLIKEMDVQSVLGAPLIVGELTFGSLVLIDSQDTNRFDVQDRISATLLANQAAIAIQNAQLVGRLNKFTEELEQNVEQRTEELRQERDRVDTLYQIARGLASSLELDRVLNEALTLINQAMSITQGSILMVDEATGKLIYRAAFGRRRPLPKDGRVTSYQIGVGLAGKILESRKPVIIPNLLEDEDWIQDDKPLVHRSVLAAPLITGYEIVGVLMLYHTQIDYFTDDHLRLIEAAAPIIATAVYNAGLYNLISDQVERMGMLLGEVRVEASKNEAIVEGIADGVLVLDNDYNVQLINPAAAEILGVERASLQNKNLGSFISPAPATTDERLCYELYRTITTQHPGLNGDGELLPPTRIEVEEKVVLLTISSVTLSANAPASTLVVLRDISREAEVDRMKNEFISTVSHELRTPMTSIKGYTDLLVNNKVGPLSDMQRKFVYVIKNNADRLSSLVNDILDISRIDTGRVKLEPQYIDLETLVNNIIPSFSNQLEEKDLSFSADIPETLPKVFADSNRVTQILVNLLGNAIKYTHPDDSVSLKLTPLGKFVQIDVGDTGLGLSEEDQAHVFDRFFRAERDADSLVDGTGLGLPIAKMFVEMMRGKIWVESELGVGSTFSFTLPTDKPPVEETSIAELIEQPGANVLN